MKMRNLHCTIVVTIVLSNVPVQIVMVCINLVFEEPFIPIYSRTSLSGSCRDLRKMFDSSKFECDAMFFFHIWQTQENTKVGACVLSIL